MMFRMYGTILKTRMTFPDKKPSAVAEGFFNAKCKMQNAELRPT